MKFKPFSEKYNFQDSVLVKDFPDYTLSPIAEWLLSVVPNENVENRLGTYYLEDDFRHSLNITFREVFPKEWEAFVNFAFADIERTCNILAFFLQNFADESGAKLLEDILSQGGSAYTVVKTDRKASEYDTGVYDLAERVPTAVKKFAQKALDDNDLLMEAWNNCYSRKPDYEKVVSRSCDFLESFLGKLYFPKDLKPQLKKFVHALEKKPNILNYKGKSIVDPPSLLTDLLKEASNIRGQHTRGKGRKPTEDEAVFVLHTTIYIWNLHQTS